MQTVLELVAPELAAGSKLSLEDNLFLVCFAAQEAQEQVVDSWPELASGCEVWIHQSAVSDALKEKLHVAASVENAALEFVASAEGAEPAEERVLEQHGEWVIVRVPLKSPPKVASLMR
jgi:hypothetical protein